MVKHIANINSYIVSIDSTGVLNAPGLKSGIIEHPTGGTGNQGNYIVADGSGGWSWSPPIQTQSVEALNDGIINLKDVTNVGTETVAQIKGLKSGTNGGEIQFFTKVDNLNLTRKLTIDSNGKLFFRNSGAQGGIDYNISQDTFTLTNPPAYMIAANYEAFVIKEPRGSISFIHDNRQNIIFAHGFRLLSGNDVTISTSYNSGANANIYLFGASVQSTGNFVYTSDDNLKSYEEPLKSATETLKLLKPKKYKKHGNLYTSEETPDLSNEKWHYETGFIAQEVEQIPELNYLVTESKVSVKGKEHNIKSICYNDLIGYLVKGFQEQQNEIELLKQEIINLKAK